MYRTYSGPEMGQFQGHFADTWGDRERGHTVGERDSWGDAVGDKLRTRSGTRNELKTCSKCVIYGHQIRVLKNPFVSFSSLWVSLKRLRQRYSRQTSL